VGRLRYSLFSAVPVLRGKRRRGEGTRRGKKAVVVMPYEQYERLTQRGGSLVAFLTNSPLAGSELKLERNRSVPRSIDIEP
jgi:hypothetical protein